MSKFSTGNYEDKKRRVFVITDFKVKYGQTHIILTELSIVAFQWRIRNFELDNLLGNLNNCSVIHITLNRNRNSMHVKRKK